MWDSLHSKKTLTFLPRVDNPVCALGQGWTWSSLQPRGNNHHPEQPPNTCERDRQLQTQCALLHAQRDADTDAMDQHASNVGNDDRIGREVIDLLLLNLVDHHYGFSPIDGIQDLGMGSTIKGQIRMGKDATNVEKGPAQR